MGVGSSEPNGRGVGKLAALDAGSHLCAFQLQSCSHCAVLSVAGWHLRCWCITARNGRSRGGLLLELSQLEADVLLVEAHPLFIDSQLLSLERGIPSGLLLLMR